MSAKNPVLYSNAMRVNQSLIDQLGQLPYSPTGTRRICLHQDESAPLHMMLVNSQHGDVFPIHRHTDGDEMTFIIDGELEITLFGENPTAAPEVCIVSTVGDTKAIRIPKNCWHQTRSLTANAIYFEVKSGPFDRAAMELFTSIDAKSLNTI